MKPMDLQVETQPGYLSLEAAAKWAGHVSVRTILRWTKEGLPTVQVCPGGRRLVRIADLDAFLASRRAVQSCDLNVLVDTTAQDLGLRRQQTIAEKAVV